MKPLFINGSHDYDLKVEDDKYTLYYSNSAFWYEHIRGTIAFELENTGSGYKITQQKKKFLDYSEICLLSFLLRLEIKDYKFEIGEKIEIM